MTRALVRVAGLAVAVASAPARSLDVVPSARFAQGSQSRPPTAGRGNAAPMLYAQHCAGCHGPNLQGGSATSLIDDEWKHGADDRSITRTILDGVPGTPMAPFRGTLDDLAVRQIVFHIRQQAAAAKSRPQLQIDPDGRVVTSESQTVRLEVAAKGLETPWALAFLPDGRMLVTERPGRLRIVDKGKVLAPVSGTPAVWARQDGGMFDVEVHPDYGRNGWIYLSYAEPGPNDTSMTSIVRGRIRGNAWVDEQAIYKAPPELFDAANVHYGSRFIFDRDGHLFYTIGDRGRAADAQDLGRPAGKVHRVNDDGSVPMDNPFVGKARAIGSIWSYGHRNPQGLAFDDAGGLWASEHGPRGGDELNRIHRGRNYGWPVVSYGLEPGVTKSEQEGMESPVAHWNPSIGPAGMAFAAGVKYPGWRGSLLLAALAGQHLRRIEIDGTAVTEEEVVFDQFGRVRDIVMGPDGFLYVSLNLPGQRMSDTTAGVIVRLIPQP